MNQLFTSTLTAQTFKKSLASLRAASDHPNPSYVANLLALGGSLDMYTFHYYGMYRENKRNDVLLAADVCEANGVPLMHSEVHKLGGEAEREHEIDVAEDLLAHFVDCQGAGVANYV